MSTIGLVDAMMKPIWKVLIAVPGILVLYIAYRNWPWWRENPEKYLDMFSTPVIALVVTLLLTMLCARAALGISNLISDCTKKVWHQCWKATMVSMRNADGVSGSVTGGIFMIFGHIDSEQIYHYYTLNSDGSFQPHIRTADSYTAIYEEDRKDGEVVQYDIHLKNDWMLWFTEPDDRLRIEFHIPKGSLKQSFSLN